MSAPSTEGRSVSPAIREMGGPAALPRANGELVFEAPWQGRAFGMAVATVDRLGIDWEEFRRRLVAAIDAEPERPYYESWVAALEALLIDHDIVSGEEIRRVLSALG